jgi:hypothetical protein
MGELFHGFIQRAGHYRDCGDGVFGGIVWPAFSAEKGEDKRRLSRSLPCGMNCLYFDR